MTRLVRTELLKLRTTRMLPALLGLTAATTALMVSLQASRAGSGGAIPPLGTTTGLTDVITFTYFGLLLALVFGVTVASGEFRHATATATYLAVPRRGRVLVAKLVAAGLAGLAFGVVAAGVATSIGLAFAAGKGVGIALSASTVLRFGAGATLGAGLLSAVGVAVGTLIRHQIGGVVGVFAWALVVERLLDSLFPAAAPYLPWTAATSIGKTTLESGTSALPIWAATAIVAGVGAVVAILAWRTTIAKDVA